MNKFTKELALKQPDTVFKLTFYTGEEYTGHIFPVADNYSINPNYVNRPESFIPTVEDCVTFYLIEHDKHYEFLNTFKNDNIKALKMDCVHKFRIDTIDEYKVIQ